MPFGLALVVIGFVEGISGRYYEGRKPVAIDDPVWAWVKGGCKILVGLGLLMLAWRMPAEKGEKLASGDVKRAAPGTSLSDDPSAT